MLITETKELLEEARKNLLRAKRDLDTYLKMTIPGLQADIVKHTAILAADPTAEAETAEWQKYGESIDAQVAAAQAAATPVK
jgi:hypothetical protein